jgi:hypothetical protein
MKFTDKLRVLVPCILIFGAIGALVGGPSDHSAAGIRVGIIFGGIAAYVYFYRKKSGSE